MAMQSVQTALTPCSLCGIIRCFSITINLLRESQMAITLE